MKLNVPKPGRTLTRRQLAKFFKRSLRTIDRWGIARSELLTQKEGAARVGVSERAFLYLREAPDFPKPIRIGAPLWRAEELDAWQARRKGQNGNAPQQLAFL